MEHSFADLLSDAFSDTSLPCYQEGELDFESLNLHKGDGEGNRNERLPALTEVDEHDDAEEEEEARCVSMGTSEEEPNWRRCGLPQGEDWGDTIDLERQEVEDRCEISAEDEDLPDDKHAGALRSLLDRSQMISLRRGCLEGDEMESRENTESGEQTHDLWKAREFSTQLESSKEDHGVECPQADVPHGESDSGGEGEEEDQRGLKDGRNLSEVLSFKNQKGEKEPLGHTDTDSDIDSDADTDANSDSDTVAVTDVTPVADVVTGSEAGLVTDAAADAEGDDDTWTGGLAEECCFSVTEGSLDYFLPADPFRGELKEFSEADCGVIGEGYAEYPSEGEEERRNEEENVEQESERGLGQLSEAWMPQAGAELSEWELMEGVVEVEGCEEQETGENKRVSSAGEREEDRKKGGYDKRDDVGLDIEEEMELSDSSSLRSEGDPEVLNEGSELESAGVHGKRLLDWTEDQGNDEGEDFNERKKDDDSYGEIMYKIKWTGEEWDPGREEDLKLAVRHEQFSADEEGILQSSTQDQTNKDKENVVHVMTHQQACADEEDVCHVENEEGNVDGGSGVSSGGCPGDALGGWSAGVAPLSVSTSDCSSRLSESESSSSDSEPWLQQTIAPATLRGLSAAPPHLQPGSYSQEEDATELFSAVYTQRVPGAEEREFANEEEEEEEEAERNWDQERKRIQAFYRYYDDEEEDYDMRREGQGHSSRKHMVRFCLDALPLQRDSDGSDTDISSSSEGAEDSDSAVTGAVTSTVTGAATSGVTGAATSGVTGAVTGAVTSGVTGAVTSGVTSGVTGTFTSEVAGAVTWMPVKTEGNGESESHRRKFSLLLQESQITQVELKKLSAELRAQHQRNRVPSVLRSALKLSLVSMLGVIMFWWATDQLEWTGPDWNL